MPQGATGPRILHVILKFVSLPDVHFYSFSGTVAVFGIIQVYDLVHRGRQVQKEIRDKREIWV